MGGSCGGGSGATRLYLRLCICQESELQTITESVWRENTHTKNWHFDVININNIIVNNQTMFR